MEYCKNCGKPIVVKMFGAYHIDSSGFSTYIHCYPFSAPAKLLNLKATPKTKHDKIKEIIDDL